ncbi:MAG: MFS transporter [Alphaproteobacteria bacterium]|nr:MFS transporter [Alphaproteobacteria bacterium]
MTRQILPIAALLLGSAFLLFAGGINALILPVRGAGEGFSSFSLGLIGTGWAVGYVLGCALTPGLVARVGHIRSFSVMAAVAGLAVLLSLLLITPWAWIPLRAMSGFCFAGAAMIVEGWLSERSDAQSRGMIFGIYMTINLVATTAGQMILTAGDPMGHVFFVLAAMFYMLALIPTAVSSSASPKPLVQARLNLNELYRNSPVAVVAAFFVGVANGAFGTLSAVYATGIGLDLKTVALFASLPILAAAVAQVPTGMLSDRFDRRLVLFATAVIALGVDLYFVVAQPDEAVFALLAVSLLGAALFTMYPLLLAHANDFASPDDYVLTSGSLLLVFGVGAIFGPLLAGTAMETAGVRGLFVTMAAAHIVIGAYTLWRTTVRAPLPMEEKAVFVAMPIARTSTPQTAEFAPARTGAGDNAQAD